MENWINKNYTLVLSIFVFLLFMVRAIFSFGLEHDEAEMVLLSQKLALGNNQQPPLYNWIIIFTNKLANNILISSLIVKNFIFFGILYFIYKAAYLHFTKKIYAFFASASLAILNHFSIESLGYTHTLLVIFAVAFFIWVIARLIIKPSILNYLLLGLALAIGILSKYNFILSVAAFFLAALLQRPYRKFLFTPKLLLSISICILLISPHFYWLLDHYKQSTGETLQDLRGNDNLSRMQQIISGLLELLKQVFVILIPLIIFLPILIRKESKGLFKVKPSGFATLIGTSILISFTFIILIIIGLGASNMHTRWLLPIFLFAPLFLFGVLDAMPALAKRRVSNFIKFQYFSFGFVLLIFTIRIVLATTIGYKDRINRPYKHFANYLKQEVKIDQQNIDLIVSNRRDLGGNMKIYLNNFPIETMNNNGKFLFNLDLVKNPRNMLLVFHPKDKDYVLKCYENKHSKLKQYGTFKHLLHYSDKKEFEFAYAIVIFEDTQNP